MAKEQLNSDLSKDIVIYLQKKKGMKLKEIGELMGLSESYVSHVRKGRRALNMNRLKQLEKALNKSLPLLFLEAAETSSMPVEIKEQYELLQRVLDEASELNKKLSDLDDCEE